MILTSAKVVLSTGLLLAALVTSSCADSTSPFSSDGIEQGLSPSFLTIADWDTQSLGVSVSGPNKYLNSTAGGYTYSAAVTGGQGPYMYDWFEQECYDGGACDALHLAGSGIGYAAHSVYLDASFRKKSVIVHVYDAQTYAHVGVARKITINWSVNNSGDGSDFTCDLGADFYPVQGSDGRYYRRNGCNGNREYPPQP